MLEVPRYGNDLRKTAISPVIEVLSVKACSRQLLRREIISDAGPRLATICFYDLETRFSAALRVGVQFLCSEHESKKNRENRDMATPIKDRISSVLEVNGSQRNDCGLASLRANDRP
jgi:hypothetical protein